MLRYFPEGFLINTQDNLKAISTSDTFINAYNENRILEARASYCD